MPDPTPGERATQALQNLPWHSRAADIVAYTAIRAAFDVDEIARVIYENSPGYRGAHDTWSYDDLKAGWLERPYPDYPHLYSEVLRMAEAIRAALLGGGEGDA